MNLSKKKVKTTLKPNIEELQKSAEAQGVNPFNFDEALGEGKNLWTPTEFEEFEKWLLETRLSDNKKFK